MRVLAGLLFYKNANSRINNMIYENYTLYSCTKTHKPAKVLWKHVKLISTCIPHESLVKAR